MSQHFLVVGFGSIGRRHIGNIRTLFPDARLSVLRHKDSISQDEMSKLGIDECFTDIHLALRENPTAAIIAGPSTTHIGQCLTCAKHGIHLLVEKPLSSNLAQVDQLLDLCKKNNICLMVGYNLRFLPSLKEFFQILKSGKIGRINSVHSEVGQNLESWRPLKDYRTSVSAQKRLGGGVLLELSHEIDYLNWIFGLPYKVNGVVKKQSGLEINVEDMAHILIEWKDEEGHSIYGTLSMDFFRHDPVRYCHVVGENGSLKWNCLNNTIEYYSPKKKSWDTLFTQTADVDESYRHELLHFVDCIENGAKPLVNGDDGKGVLQFIDAVRRSSELRGEVDVQTNKGAR